MNSKWGISMSMVGETARAIKRCMVTGATERGTLSIKGAETALAHF